MDTKVAWTSNKLRALGGIVDVMLAQDDVEQFARPATPDDFLGDDKELRLEEYHRIITRPMDFSTVQDRLQRCLYRSSEACIKDVQQIFTNCRAYNNPRDHVARVGRRLATLFKVLLSKALPREEEVVTAVDMAPRHQAAPQSAPQSAPQTAPQLVVDLTEEVKGCRAMPLSAKLIKKIKMIESELKSVRTCLKDHKSKLRLSEERNEQILQDITKCRQKAADLQNQLLVKDRDGNEKYSSLKFQNQKVTRENYDLTQQLKAQKEKLRSVRTKIDNVFDCSSQQGSPPKKAFKSRPEDENLGTFLIPMPFNVHDKATRIQESDTYTGVISSPESSKSIVFGRNKMNMSKRRFHQHARRINSLTKQRRLF